MFKRMGIAFLIALIPNIFILVRLIKSNSLTPRSQKIVEEAKKAGRVSTGYLSKQRSMRYDTEDKGKFLGDRAVKVVYEYIVDGHVYRWRGMADTLDVPETMDFYYPEGKPSKAIPEGYFDPGGKVVFLHCLPAILWVCTYGIMNLIWPE